MEISLDIIFFATIAVIIAIRLFKVLGQDDDDIISKLHEQNVSEAQEHARVIEPEFTIEEVESSFNQKSIDKLGEASAKIQKLDPEFNAARFIKGAKKAYEIILKAFSDGNKNTLKNLLSEKLYKEFETEIEELKTQGHYLVKILVATDRAEITDIKFKNNIAKIKVKFETEQIIFVKDKDGQIISGSNSDVDKYIDIWEFSRDVSKEDPVWLLVSVD